MKIIGKLLIVISMISLNCSVFALVSNIPRPFHGSSYQHNYSNQNANQNTYQKNYSCPSQYYYGYNFDSSTYDYQVDTACVDFCIDKEHTLQQCMRSCSQR